MQQRTLSNRGPAAPSSPRLLALALAAVLVAASAPAWAQRSGPGQQRKAYLLVNTDKLSLKWNADTGEGGSALFDRGRGEIFYTAWIFWPVETCSGTNPDHGEEGPVGGTSKFPSGEIIDDPNNPGKKTIEPAEVELNKRIFGLVTADCPVADYIEVDVLVWEEDSNKTLTDYIKIIADEIDDSELDKKYMGILGIAARVIQVLIDALTADADDPVGKFRGQISIPDPCAGPFVVDRTVELANMTRQLWKDVDALDENDDSFKDAGISPPDFIGELQLRITGGLFFNHFSSHVVDAGPLGDHTDARVAGIGQVDEAIVTAAVVLADAVPADGSAADVAYRLMLDTDNDPATGSPEPTTQGAEFEMRVQSNADGDPVATLLRYDPDAGAFIPDPAGLHDAGFNAWRHEVFASVRIDDIGVPDGGEIAHWVVVQRGADVLDLLTPNPAEFAPIIAVHREYTGLPPFVARHWPSDGQIDVPLDEGVVIRFSKAVVEPAAEAAFAIFPPTPGEFSWRGNTMTFRPAAPLLPATTYEVLVLPEAIDTVGTPLDDDLDGLPSPAAFSFSTEEPRLAATDADGAPRGMFFIGEPIHARASELPPARRVDLYLIRAEHGELAGRELEDVSDDGVNGATVLDDGSLLAFVGRMHADGEYNLVVDVDRDGRFTPAIDRVDAAGIGLYYQLVDCNGNGVDDAIDIINGDSRDDNANGIPDECDCRADLDFDGDRDVADFFLYLDYFASGDDRADLTGSSDPNNSFYGIPDGVIDVVDFFFYLDLFEAGCE